MDKSLREGTPADAWCQSFAQSIGNERQRATQRVKDHRQRLSDLDARIATQLEAAIEALSHEQEQVHQTATQTQTKVVGLDERQKLLDQRQKQLDARQEELDKLQADLTASKPSESERLKDAKRREAELKAAKEANEAELARLNAEREAFQQRESNLVIQEQTLAAREQQTKRQRQIVARQLRARKKELIADAAQEESTRHFGELEQIRRESQQQVERLRADYTTARSNETQVLRQQLEELRARLVDAEAAHDSAVQECDEQRSAIRKTDTAGHAATAELTRLRDENQQLWSRLEKAEQEAQNSGNSGGNTQEMEDLRRRFEMAVQDVRELKTKNVELTEQLAEAKKSPHQTSSPSLTSTGGGWESLKQKLMADLDSDFDESAPAQKADKLTVQSTIKITDEIVAEKDREIEELQRLLDSQAQQVGEVAVGAAAVAQMLDTNELVQQEREALKRLQDQLRDQLRQAELDISVERARLAREQSEMEEKLRVLEAEKANLTASAGSPTGDNGKKPGRRKWLTRLGLGENGES